MSDMKSHAPVKIAVFGNSWQDEHLPALASLFGQLVKVPVKITIEKDFAAYLELKGIVVTGAVAAEKFPADSDLVISIGGDGTFLRAADWVGRCGVPLLGINTGHLGYLAGFSLERPEEVFSAIEGDFQSTKRMLLRIESDSMPDGFRPFALNEVSVSKGDTTSMVSIRASVNGRYLTCYLADGLIISTPTGSTAYNLSCGGPILQPTMQSVILTPIAPHSLTLRPLVIDADSVLELEVSSRGEEIHIGVDGRTFALPSTGTRLTVRRAPFVLNVAQPPSTDFASVLRTKLGWGS